MEIKSGCRVRGAMVPEMKPTKPVQLVFCAKGQLHICTITGVAAPRRFNGSTMPRDLWMTTESGLMPAVLSCEPLWALPDVAGSAF